MSSVQHFRCRLRFDSRVLLELGLDAFDAAARAKVDGRTSLVGPLDFERTEKDQLILDWREHAPTGRYDPTRNAMVELLQFARSGMFRGDVEGERIDTLKASKRRHSEGLPSPSMRWVLHDAVTRGDLEGVIELLGRGADPNGDVYNADGVLTRAAKGNHVALLRPLLDAGADLARVRLGDAGSMEVFQLLLDAGVDRGSVDESDISSLLYRRVDEALVLALVREHPSPRFLSGSLRSEMPLVLAYLVEVYASSNVLLHFLNSVGAYVGLRAIVRSPRYSESVERMVASARTTAKTSLDALSPRDRRLLDYMILQPESNVFMAEFEIEFAEFDSMHSELQERLGIGFAGGAELFGFLSGLHTERCVSSAWWLTP